MDQATENIIGNVRAIRTALHWSAQKVANKCAAIEGGQHMHRGVIANFESGRRKAITVQELLVFSEVFGVSPMDMMTPGIVKVETTVTVTLEVPGL